MVYNYGATDFMFIDIMCESQLNSYESTDKEFHCVMDIAIDFMLVDTMFESHLYGYLSTGNGLWCIIMVLQTSCS